MSTKDYYGFISHRSVDKDFALWLQKKIENYTIPRSIRKQKNLSTSKVKNICLDVASFSGSELKAEVDKKLEKSEKLILICSKASASPVLEGVAWNKDRLQERSYWKENPSQTGWVGYEIVRFLEMHENGEKDIIPIVIDGDPLVSKDCFHPVLEPLFNKDTYLWRDFTGGKPKSRDEFLHLISAILGVENFDDFKKRDAVRQRTTWISIGSAIAAGVALSIFAFDYFIPRSSSYSDYKLINGIPEGVGKLSSGNTVEDHYIITKTKYNKTTKLEHVNSHNIPVEETTEQHIDPPMIATYKCRNNGSLDTVEYIDRNGIVQFTYAYATDMQYVGFQENEFVSDQVFPTAEENEYGVPIRLKIDRYDLSYDDNGLLNRRMYMSGVNYVVDDDGIAGERYEYNDNGVLTEIRYVNKEGQDTSNKKGVYGILFEYDGRGKRIKKSYIGKDGTLIFGEEGYAYSETKYNSNGTIDEISFFDIDGKKVINKSGYAVSKYTYEGDSGDINTISFFGKENNPVFCKKGYHKIEYEHNKNGDITKETYYNENDKIVFSENGYAMVERDFDENGNITRTSYLSADSNPVATEDKSATVLQEIDDNGYIIKKTNLNVKGEKFISKDGYCLEELTLDDKGRPIVLAYYGVDGEPVYNTKGYHKICLKYDEMGNTTEVTLLGLNDELIPFSGYWAKQKMEYNGGGEVTNVYYEDQFGNPVKIKGGYASIVNEYSDNGLLTSTSYYDEQGELKGEFGSYKNSDVNFGERTYAKLIFEYDDNGNMIKKTYIDDGGKQDSKAPYNYVSYERDEFGNILKTSFYKADGTVAEIDKCHEIIRKYDDYGNITETAYYNANGNPCKSPLEDYHKVLNEFDKRGNVLKTEYIDTENNLIDSKVLYSYDDDGNKISEKYFSNTGTPFKRENGYSEIDYSYKYGKLLETVYKNAEGVLVDNNNGFSIERKKYDDLGNVSEIAYFDSNEGRVNNASLGFHRMTEKLNSVRNTTETCFYDKNDELVLRYVIEYLDDRYMTFEAVYDGVGKLLPDTDFGVAKCVYAYDKYHNETDVMFYNDNDKLINISGECAGCISEYENGKETKRLYIGENGKPKELSQGFSSVEFIYDEYGREVKRQYFDSTNNPVDTKFGFQSYEIEYDDNNEISKSVFFDKNGKAVNNLSGKLKNTEYVLGGNYDSKKKTIVDSIYAKKIVYETPDGGVDLSLRPHLSLTNIVTDDIANYIYISKQRMNVANVKEGASNFANISDYDEKNSWIELLDKYIDSAENADIKKFFEVYMMDYFEPTLKLLNTRFDKNVTSDDYYRLYESFFRDQLSLTDDDLQHRYGEDYEIKYEIVNINKPSTAEVEKYNDSIQSTLPGATKIEDYVNLSVRFICEGEKGSGEESDGLLSPSMTLFKVNGKWKLGNSNDFPKIDNDELLKLFR